jgi:NADH-quinone oxidoreductase subunit N
MGTIIATTVLGLLGLVMDMFKLRKAIVPLVVLALLVIAGYNLQYWNLNQGFFTNMILIDNFAVAFSGLLVLITALLIALASYFYKEEEDKLSDYISLMLFTLTGALMMVSFGNMATLFLGIEILSVSLYILAGSKRRDLISNEAGLKYFLMGSFSTGFLLLGITLIYGVTASFDIQAISYSLNHQAPSPLLTVGLAMMMIAMLFKASIAPFHFWAPDVYSGAPSLMTAFMSTVAKVAAFAAIYKLFSYTFGMQAGLLEPLLVLFVVLTLLIGNFSALRQSSVKRIMAYSGLSHAGFMLMAVVATTMTNPGTLFFYATGYAMAGVAAFAVIVYVSHSKGDDGIDQFTGLAYEKPGLAVGMILALLSMAGIPPLAGFFGKYLVFMETISVGYLWLAIVGVLVSVVSVYYYFRIIWAMLRKPLGPAAFSPVPVVYSIVLWVSALALLALGILPSFFAGLLK